MQLATRYQQIKKRVVWYHFKARLFKETLEWLIAIGLFCALCGYEIGSMLLAIFTPLCKRLWVLAMTVTHLYF
ncbi:MAG: hypothetical protein AAFO04_05435 [Cyanobacteria bacterium J06592_8]